MTTRTLGLLFAVVVATGCRTAPLRDPATAVPSFTTRSIALPGASATGVSLDYSAYDRTHRRVWVPAGETGTVAVVDVRDDHLALVSGFTTADVEQHGVMRGVGPSSATVGNGFVYVGNRADSRVCAVDAKSLRVGACVTLAAMPDGLAYVAATKEVWATTPRRRSIAILDASDAGTLTPKGEIALDGAPEGFAVDDGRGVFYTNFEDKDRTLTIDVKSRQVTRNWPSQCGADGPRGLAVDPHLNFLFVACTSRVMVLDAGHDGKQLSTMDVSEGIDNIDYVEVRKELFAAAGRAAKLVIAHVDA